MNKAFSNFTWENEPSENTAVNAENLNKINNAIDTIDSRVVTHETTKLDKTTANTMVKDVVFDSTTGIFTITKLNGSVLKIDTKLEKLAVNFNYNKNTQILSIILDDGTTQEVDLSSLISQYEFAESDTIILSVGTDGKVTANIKSGSITGDMLEPNYLANVTTQADSAKTSAQTAEMQANRAKTEADRAQEAAKEAEAATGLHIDTTLSSTSVNPVQNKVIKSALDSIQTTSSGTLSQAGWYRVAEYKGLYSIDVNGYCSNSCELDIKKMSSGTDTDYYKLELISTNNKQSFACKSSKCNNQTITQIRYVKGANNIAYIEVYHNVNKADKCFFEITHGHDYQNLWQAITPTLTSETVDGVTVTTTYDIPSNASPVTDLDLAQVDGTEVLKTSILEKALTLEQGVYQFRLGGTNYTGNDLPNTSYGYGYATVYVWAKSVNVMVVLWGTSYSNTPIATQFYTGSAWREDWLDSATTADLANYLPKTGGEVDGSIVLKSNATTFRHLSLVNQLRTVRLALYEDGSLRLRDETNAKNILVSEADGTNAFNGTASGNLPLNGGGTVSKASDTPISVNNTVSNAIEAYIGLQIGGVQKGLIGVKNGELYGYGSSTGGKLLHTGNFSDYALAKDGGGEVTKASDIILSVKNKTEGAVSSLIAYTDGNGKGGAMGFSNGKPWISELGEIHHDSNSAKVHVGASAPSDTFAVWYDTTNKVIKYYKDGAWQQ